MTGFYKGYTSKSNEKHWALGAPSNPTIARQLEEFNKLLNQGIKNIEIGTISSDKFEQIPQQHFDEVRRLAKLTDAKPSVHAPLLDLAGFQENRWREEQRSSTEQQVFSILERSHQLTIKDKSGKIESVPVVFHAGNTFSQEYGVPYDEKNHKDGLYKEEYEKDQNGNITVKKIPTDIRAMAVINQDTGEITGVAHEKKFRLGSDKEEIWDVDKRLRSLNASQWDQERLKLLNHQKEIEDLKEKMNIKIKQNEAIDKTNLSRDENYQQIHSTNFSEIERMRRHIEEINKILDSEYESTYNKLVKFAPKEHKDELNEVFKKVKEQYKKDQEQIIAVKISINEDRKKFSEAKENNNKEEMMRLQHEIYQKSLLDLELNSQQSKKVVTVLGNPELPTPEIWTPIKEFAVEKTAETVAGAVSKLYEKLKKEGKQDETPFIALENFFVHTPMSTAEKLREAVELSREKLSEKLQSKEGANLSKEDAKKAAEKLVGATWDVGHINNIRKAGYEGEELKQKMLEQAKIIADVTKHVHITDNFGFFDSHLPPGMGNVPIKDIMEQMEKTWAKMAEEGKLLNTPRGIVEAGGFVAEIGQNPTIGILEYFNSPLFKMSPSPYWGGGPRGGIAHGYSGYRETFLEFPQQHFNLYGSSFTTLPKTVGGQVGNESSRFSGTPNQ